MVKVINNANLLDFKAKSLYRTNLIIEHGKIKELSDTVYTHSDALDLYGKILLKTFCDYHIHAPGTWLYDLFGVNLSEADIRNYAEIIKDYIAKGAHIVRGFGWNIEVLEDFFSQSKESPLEFLDAISVNIPIALFSLDFHSCWCNTAAINILHNTSPEFFDDTVISNSGNGLLHKHIAYILFKNEYLSFSQTEVEEAFLSFQKQAISYGIQEVFCFMFIGIDALKAYKVLATLEKKEILIIKFHCCYDVYLNDTIESMADKIKCSKEFTSEHVDFIFAKIYIDGVIENHTALLHEPYSDKPVRGTCIWEENKLQEMVNYFQENDIPVHFHAIGDRAVSIAVKMTENSNKRSLLRNTITHLQLCTDEDIQKMRKEDIVACFQPFWFFKKHEAPEIDIIRIGEARAAQEYPVSKILDIGGSVLFSSDCPVVRNFCPLLGIKMACETQPDSCERLYDYIAAYQTGAYNGKSPSLTIDNDASFVVLDTANIEDIMNGTTKINSVFINGKEIITKDNK